MKKKLIASAVSLAMALVMLTSASFAWFTVSTAPEINNIKVQMTATKNLEIAEATDMGTTEPGEVTANDGTTESTWGSVVNFAASDAAAVTVNFPATIDGAAIKTINYNSTGRTAGLTATVAAPTTLANGVGKYTASVTMPSGSAASKDIAIVYGCWLRSNVDVSDLTMTITPPASAKFSVAYKIGTGGTLTKAASNEVTNLSLTADAKTFVQIILYVDGGSVNAADVDTGIGPETFKVAFSSATVSG